jgi:hypothetical protein
MMMSDPFFSPTAIQFGNQGPYVEWVTPPKRARRIDQPRAKVNSKTFTATVSWSNYFRVCQHDGCNRAIGRNGKSYLYGSAWGEPKRDVCHRCHMKLQRPSRRAWRLKFEASSVT